MERRSLGHILREQGLITQPQLDDALAVQSRTGDRLGHILMTQGIFGPLALHQAIATHHDLPFIRLDDTPADADLQKEEDAQTYIRLAAIPYAQDGNTMVIAAAAPSQALEDWARERFGAFRLVVTSPYDIYRHIDRYFASRLDEHSRLALWNLMPEKSARVVLTRQQKKQMLTCVVGLFLLLLFYPATTLAALLLGLTVFCFFTLLLKFRLFMSGLSYRPGQAFTKEELTSLDEAGLPVYTVLVPLHDESESLPRLLRSLDALDYPKAKLDIKLVLERSDEKTANALKALRPHAGYELVYVPYSLPQTKPKACNYALHFARGEYVTIYDAEDDPDPQQLKKAVLTFRRLPESVICLQARLNYYNRNDSLLPRLFALEYAMWFDYMLPGLQSLNIPIPLGGTSNHLRLSELRRLGEWDPYNVTEDADLGIRIAMGGRKTAMLDSLTGEEAPAQLKPWLNQRTRWIRGYMQTWLVHMRDPLSLLKTMPAQAFWGFQFFIGGPCLMFLVTPFLWLLCFGWLADVIPFPGSWLGYWILPISAFNLGFGLVSHYFYALHVIARYRWQGMLAALLAFPFYWFLHSYAAYRALWLLCRNPHVWEKTPHGLSSASESEKERALQAMR